MLLPGKFADSLAGTVSGSWSLDGGIDTDNARFLLVFPSVISLPEAMFDRQLQITGLFGTAETTSIFFK